MTDRCHECGGVLFAARHVRVIFDRDGDVHMVDHVPAGVCVQCGERYFSPPVAYALAAAQNSPPDEFVLVLLRHLA